MNTDTASNAMSHFNLKKRMPLVIAAVLTIALLLCFAAPAGAIPAGTTPTFDVSDSAKIIPVSQGQYEYNDRNSGGSSFGSATIVGPDDQNNGQQRAVNYDDDDDQTGGQQRAVNYDDDDQTGGQQRSVDDDNGNGESNGEAGDDADAENEEAASNDDTSRTWIWLLLLLLLLILVVYVYMNREKLQKMFAK
ncbi:MAG: hypothetical protein FWE54_04580 [Methanimicrococcus sp.]|nr:hypothetical protein [Methanimicrococcus sp.]